MNYDREIFDFFREKAVTDPMKLVLNKKYYSNFLHDSFVLLGVQLNDVGLFMNIEVCKDGEYLYKSISMRDNNIGDSYNPWLIFENEIDAEYCRKFLVIRFN